MSPPDVEPTDAEVEDIRLAVQKLWELDDNRLVPGRDYEINVQRGKTVYASSDGASEKLFTRVHKDIWKRPTYLIFYNLLDNYVPTTGTAETVTMEEKKEMVDFLDACMATRPMQYLHRYLVAKNIARCDPMSLKNILFQMWFAPYNRDGQADSSGFEHVFVGEVDEGATSGLHNWIQFWIQEAKGKIDYRGYVLPKKRGSDATDDEDQLLTVQFAWEGAMKPVSSMFIGTSPEFELALYSLCFLCGEERTDLEIQQYDLAIRCYRIRSKYGDKVGSAFPELTGEDPTNQLAALRL